LPGFVKCMVDFNRSSLSLGPIGKKNERNYPPSNLRIPGATIKRRSDIVGCWRTEDGKCEDFCGKIMKCTLYVWI
jgi:hypothetical protein